MYVIDRKLERVTTMKGKELAEFLNVVVKLEIGDFSFASTEQEAGQIILSIIQERYPMEKQKKKEKYN